MRHFNKLLIIIIIALAAVIRFYRLDLYPPSLNWDEVSHGYNAYSILQTGHDEWGNFFPTIFRAFGDYKLPVYIYLTIPFIELFELTAYGVRTLSALAGIGSVLFTYLLANKLFRIFPSREGPSAMPRRDVLMTLGPLTAALLLATSPWSIFLSRIAVEANLASFFIISGAYYWLLGVEQKHELDSSSATNSSPYQGEARWGFLKLINNKSWGFALSGLLLGLSLFTYNSARIFTPLLLILLLYIYRKTIFKIQQTATCNCHLIGICIFLLIFTGMIYQLVLPEGQARFQNIGLLNEGAINQINQNRGASTLPAPFPRLLHNKATYFLTKSTQNYLSFFNPQFMFFRGGSHYQFNIPGHGLFYPAELLLLIPGLLWIFKMPRQSLLLILGWLLLAPIPASPTRDNPHSLRIITLLPILQLISGWGALQLYQYFTTQNTKLFSFLKYLFIAGFLYLIFFSTRNFWTSYTHEYRSDYSWAWQFGHQTLVQYLKTNYQKYDQIFITKKHGEPHEFILFYWPWDPADYRSKVKWDYHADWYWINEFDKFKFINDWEIQEQLRTLPAQAGKNQELKTLLVTSPANAPPGWKHVFTIHFLNGKPAFELYESPVTTLNK